MTIVSTTTELVPVPPRPAGGNNKSLHAYFEASRETIIAEVRLKGEPETTKRWGIDSATWVGLKRRWGLPIHLRTKHKKKHLQKQLVPRTVVLGEKKDEVAGEIGRLPPFNNEWHRDVQIKWLECFIRLCELGKEGVEDGR